MDLKLMNTAVCRTPAFSTGDTLEQCWTALKEMIGESSPEFYRVIENMDYSGLGEADEKVKFSLWKYFNRARFRATPFGSFAAISFVPIVEDSGKLVLERELVKHLFTDWGEKDAVQDMQGAQWFQTNTTCYNVGSEIRYIRFRDNQFELATAPASPELNTLLALCRDKTNRANLYKTITGFGMTRRSADNLLAQMLGSQLLLSDCSPNITGPDYFERLDIPRYTNPYIITERKLHSGGLDAAIPALMPEWFNFVKIFIPGNANANMDAFRREFSTKFDLQAVPLALAIDPETGVGYGGLAREPQEQELDDIFGGVKTAPVEPAIANTPQYRFLLNSLLSGGEIRLENFKGKPAKPSPVLPNTFSAIFSYWNDIPVMESAGGCTANSLLGRFTIAGGQAHELAKQIAGIEEKANGDVLFFDVAYQAEKKVDNVNRRQQLYENELPILSWSCHDGPLSLDDILVMHRNNEIILWSKKHRRRLIPRIASAYNYTRSDLAVYRFLCDLQHQGISADLTFRLRQFFPDLDYYPRVYYKNIIVSNAMWKLPAGEGIPTGLKTWLSEKNIDFHFKCGNADQTLCFDPRSDDDLLAFLTYWKQNKSKELYITEALLGDTVADEHGKTYVPQYIVNFFHTQEVYPAGQQPPDDKPGKVFHPGSEWLYFEIYCHPLRGNQVIKLLRKFTGAHKKYLKKWFFIRYTDPAPHIRFRLHLKDILATGILMSELETMLSPLLNSGLISAIQLKAYSPEYVRYGAKRMALAEQLFYLDSVYVGRLIAGETDTRKLYIITVKLMEHWLLLTGLADDAAFIQAVADKFSGEFLIDKEGYKKINKAFEGIKNEIGIEPLPLSPRYREGFVKIINACKSETEKQTILADLIHMHINRVFYSSQRMHEAILYQYMLKLLKSRQFRGGGKPAP
jgi:thiopeptide-type bacteriocin biosynthesis protein